MWAAAVTIMTSPAVVTAQITCGLNACEYQGQPSACYDLATNAACACAGPVTGFRCIGSNQCTNTASTGWLLVGLTQKMTRWVDQYAVYQDAVTDVGWDCQLGVGCDNLLAGAAVRFLGGNLAQPAMFMATDRSGDQFSIGDTAGQNGNFVATVNQQLNIELCLGYVCMDVCMYMIGLDVCLFFAHFAHFCCVCVETSTPVFLLIY